MADPNDRRHASRVAASLSAGPWSLQIVSGLQCVGNLIKIAREAPVFVQRGRREARPCRASTQSGYWCKLVQRRARSPPTRPWATRNVSPRRTCARSRARRCTEKARRPRAGTKSVLQSRVALKIGEHRPDKTSFSASIHFTASAFTNGLTPSARRRSFMIEPATQLGRAASSALPPSDR